MERLLLIGSIFCFLASFSVTIYALGAGHFRPGRFNFTAISLGFLILTAFLYFRGQQEGSCPLNSLFDVLVFQSWSFVLIYLLVGPAYRLSLLGAFTAPLSFVLLLISLVIYPAQPTWSRFADNPWIELHASLSIIAYGAFGLACVASVMYLLQESQLKRHRASSLLYNLPPVNDLAEANGRLLFLGFMILTVSFMAGFFARMPVNGLKFSFSLGIWIVYGCILVLHQIKTVGPRRLARLSVITFALVLGTLPGIQHLSLRP